MAVELLFWLDVVVRNPPDVAWAWMDQGITEMGWVLMGFVRKISTGVFFSFWWMQLLMPKQAKLFGYASPPLADRPLGWMGPA